MVAAVITHPEMTKDETWNSLPEREQDGLDGAAGEVELLACGRDVGVERGHEM